ncbi:MAG: AAA family ATPase [Candidatus Delongbacteria bacterium]|nr:AAA family ATPase [Candidatus Delongbacteria bacterium]
MQLKSLYINDYKILKNFTIEFPCDFKKYISVFIGANGSGKSTILEAIAQIFSDTILNQTAKFGFELEYSVKLEEIIEQTSTTSEFNTAYIIVTLHAEKGEKIKASVNSGMDDTDFSDKVIDSRKMVVFGQGKEKSVQSYLPDNIIIYYSGLSEIMEDLCKPHEEKLSKAYRKGNTDIDRDFFYYKPEHFGIILLSLLSFEYGDIPKFLHNKAKIHGMQSVQIRLKRPSWRKASIEKFWGAEGEVRKFLDYLNENSATSDDLTNPESSNRKGNIVIEAWQDEALIITIIGLERLYEIREHLIEERKLFEILNIMLEDGMLENISFSLVKDDKGNSKSFNVLSEGEQQAIVIKGMTELLSGKNTLFLFDEPDTYLHPSWQRQFIGEIEKEIESFSKIERSTGQSIFPENSFLIATHSPQLLSNAKTELNFVKIIENGVLVEKTPKFYGREISSILYNLMGVEERNATIKSDISKLFAIIEDEEIEEAEKELNRLTEILGETDPDIKNAEIQLNYLKEDEANN